MAEKPKPTAGRIREVCQAIAEFSKRRDEARNRKLPAWLRALLKDREPEPEAKLDKPVFRHMSAGELIESAGMTNALKGRPFNLRTSRGTDRRQP